MELANGGADLRTLLVEDDTGTRLLFDAVLRSRGYEVAAFADAEDAWEACRESEFDLALLDWILPGMDGLELCRGIRTRPWGAWALIVVVTACDRFEDLQQVLDAGADEFLAKPVDPGFLQVRLTVAEHQLQNLLERRRAEEELRMAHDQLERRVAERTSELSAAVRRLDEEVAERERAVEALQRSEEKYRGLVENINESVLSLDTRGCLLFASPAFERLSGRSASELVGTPLETLLHPDDVPRVMTEFQATLGGTSEPTEFRILGRDQGVRHVRASMRGLWEGGSEVGATAVISDITERKGLEDRLRLAQRMEVLGQFAGGIAHNFSNTSQVLLGTADLLQRHFEPDDPRRQELDVISRASRDAAALSRSLLAFARTQVLEPGDVDLNRLVDEMLPMLARLLPENISFEHVAGDDLDYVQVDRGQIEQVVMNLCLNSRDAMPGGGTITVETGNTSIDEASIAGHPWARPGRHVFVTVRDTGCGMDEQTLARVFDPFFTTKGPGKGTGLGLASVYNTVKQHRGLIEIESRPGGGTTCRILLPAVEASGAHVEVSMDESMRGGDETVLVVEDHGDIREVVVGFLTELGYRVLEAEDGVRALELLDEDTRQVDLVLTDMSMPRMGGGELYDTARTRGFEQAFLLSSGCNTDWERMDLAGDPLIDTIEKPFDIAQLARKVRHLLG